jgi:hypothetical protein
MKGDVTSQNYGVLHTDYLYIKILPHIYFYLSYRQCFLPEPWLHTNDAGIQQHWPCNFVSLLVLRVELLCLSAHSSLRFKENGNPTTILQCSDYLCDWPAEFLHVKPGKGAAFVRSKLKNLITGSTQDKTFRAGEPLTAAEVVKSQCQYTYSEVCPTLQCHHAVCGSPSYAKK